MPHRETFIQTTDNLTLFVQIWEPDAPARAVVCLVHGFGEHSGRYDPVAEAMNTAGISLLGFDLRGHGKSQGKRGYIPNYDAMLDDIAAALSITQEQFPEIPVFLYGHSMGGNLVLNFALRRKPALTGVLATSPWLKLAYDPPAVQMLLARILYRIMPGYTLASGLDVAALARDSDVVLAYHNDPLVNDKISVRLLVDILSTGEWAIDHASEFTLPLLLVHGSADSITSPSASQSFATRAGDNCTLKIWEGFYHETHNEPEKEQVIAFNLAWLEQFLS